MAILQHIEMAHAGAHLQGQIAVPDTPGPHRAVLVMHNAHGLGDHMKATALRLARDHGYVALATDMYGGGGFYADDQSIAPVIMPLFEDPLLLRSRVAAWLAALQARPEVDERRVGAIGYCFGGQCVLELARSGAEVKAVVSYHGLLTTTMPAQPGAVKAHVAVYSGARDIHAPHEHVEGLRREMIAADAVCDITVFGDALHSFTDPDADPAVTPDRGYHPLADKLSWDGTMVLLDALL